MGSSKLLSAPVVLLILSSLTLTHLSLASTRTPITHLIVIVQENHSFDNYFGTYPTGNGTLVNEITTQLQPVDGIPAQICLPHGRDCIAPYPVSSYNTVNPYEGQLTYEEDVDGGKMDGFASYSGPQSMAYFDYHQLAAYWDYAEEYAIADNYFSTYLSTTSPNRLSMLAGYSPVSSNYGPPPYVDYSNTVFYQLDSAGISWAYFEDISHLGNAAKVYPLDHIAGIPAAKLSNIQDLSKLTSYLSSGIGLPAVNFVSSLRTLSLDEHPPYNVTQGEMWVVSLVNSVMSSSYWNSTAIFLTYDEGGGYYDHVPPPRIISQSDGFEYPLQGLGQRVPFILISPYAKENYVSETLLSHLSIIHFIDYNWNLPALNNYVQSSNLPLDMFYFNGPPRAPIILKADGTYSYLTYPIPLQIPLSSLPYDRGGSLSSSSSSTEYIPGVQEAVVAFLVALVIFASSYILRRRKRIVKQSWRL